MTGTEAVEDLIPEIDREFLNERGYRFTATRVGADVHIVFHEFAFPVAYMPRIADLLIILPAGYPSANLDMFWTRPDVKLANGRWPQACETHVNHAGQPWTWQRWSRHFAPNGWRQGIDNLRTFLTTIRNELNRGI